MFLFKNLILFDKWKCNNMFMNMIIDYSGKLVMDYYFFYEFLLNYKRNENYFFFIGYVL